MADLKINDELWLRDKPSTTNLENLAKIKSMAGNLKLVGYGLTDSFTMTKTTWGGRGFNTGIIYYDEEYLRKTGISTNSLTTVKAGTYLFFWQARLYNSGSSSGHGMNINGATQPTDDRFSWGAGTKTRSCATGVNMETLAAGTEISTCHYGDAANPRYPSPVWIFVVVE